MTLSQRRGLVTWCIVVIAAMLAVTGWASLESNVWMGFVRVGSDRWGLATLFDAYFAFIFALIFIWSQTPTWWGRITISILILALGNMAIAGWVLYWVALRRDQKI